MPKSRKQPVLWLARDSVGYRNYILGIHGELSGSPVAKGGWIYFGDSDACPRDWEHVFPALKLKPGAAPRQIVLSGRFIKEKKGSQHDRKSKRDQTPRNRRGAPRSRAAGT